MLATVECAGQAPAMKVPVRAFGQIRSMTIDFATGDLSPIVVEWSAALDSRSAEPQHDSIEYIESAATKWALCE